MFSDLRYAWRLARKSPTAFWVAVLTLAIGVGANTAIFSVLRAVVLKPLPYPNAERLVVLAERWPTLSGPKPISRLNYRDWAQQNTVFERIAVDTWGDATMTAGDLPVRVEGALVSPTYFDLFGLHAALGRTFSPAEDQPGGDKVVLLSHQLWVTQFGGDPAVIDRAIRLDGESYTIVGVMPAGASVDFGIDLSNPQIWRPLPLDAPPPRGVHDLRLAAAKMKAGVTLQQARAELEAIADRLAAAYPDTNKGYGVIVRSFPRPVGIDVEQSLLLLFAATGVVLLLACVNLANLAVARGSARVHEAAIRTALGARRTDLVRQFMTEHSLIAGVGGVGGVALAYAMLAALKTAIPTSGFRAAFPTDTRIDIDMWVLLFACALTMLSAVGCGLAPAIGIIRRPIVAGLREGSAGVGTSRSLRRTQRLLVAAEIGLAFSLLTAAGLLTRSLLVLTHRIDAGFDARHVVTARLPVPETRFQSGAAYNAYLDRLGDRLQSLAGISDVAFADSLPTEGNPFGKLFQIVGEPTVPYASRPMCGFKVVSPSYLAAVGLRLIEGRWLDNNDRATAPLAVVINQAMARTYFRGRSPLGQRMLMRRNPIRGPAGTVDLEWTVVGITADEGVSPFDDRTAKPAVYVAREQYPRLDLALVVRTATDALAWADTIRKTVASADPRQAVTDVKTLVQVEGDDLSADRFRSFVVFALAAVAMALAALGIYGVMAIGSRSELAKSAFERPSEQMQRGCSALSCDGVRS
jgi:putative ABC transport system permease protein